MFSANVFSKSLFTFFQDRFLTVAARQIVLRVRPKTPSAFGLKGSIYSSASHGGPADGQEKEETQWTA